MSGDLRAAVEGLPPEPSYKDSSHGDDYFWHGRMVGRREVLALISEGAVLVTPEDHTPTGYEGMDGYGYVSCSCGWDSSNSTGLDWSRHLREGR